MSDDRFRAYREEMFRLYNEARYAQALAHVERGMPEFPDRWADVVYWKSCLAARTGDVPLALRVLSDAVERGWWWSEAGLRRDPDLQSLQDVPEFEHLVAVCRERQADAQARSRPELLTISPQRGSPPHPILLTLHGAGGNAADFAPYWQAATTHGWLVAVPQSSQMFAPTRFHWPDLERATQEILEHYDTLLRRHPVDAKRTVLAGFSQGGRTAIWLTLSGILPARGFLGIACALPNPEEIHTLLRDREPKHRGYLIVGTQDLVYDAALKTADLIRSHSIPLEVETIDGLAHEIPQDFDRRLPRALEFLAP